MLKQEDIKARIITGIPLLIKAVSMLLIVEGALGLLFFSSIFFYQAFHPGFIGNWGFENYSGPMLYLILALFASVHGGLIVGGIYLIRLNRKGVYITLLSILVLVFMSFWLNGQLDWMGMIAGILVLILLSYFVKYFN